MTEPPNKTRNPNARAVFAANKSRIGEMLSNDRLMTEIFAELQFPGSYTQFTRYCAKAFKPAPQTAPIAAVTVHPTPLAVPASPAPALVSAGPAPGPGPIRPPRAGAPEWNPAKLRRDQVLKARTDDK